MNYLLPFIILITIVVLFMNMDIIILQENLVLVLQIFLLDLEKKFLDGMINQEQDGRFAGFR